jgi:hypothetical protein
MIRDGVGAAQLVLGFFNGLARPEGPRRGMGHRTDRRLRGRHHGRVKATRKWGLNERVQFQFSYPNPRP